MRVLQGRTFQSTDTRDKTRVAVINRTMARQWDGASPIGSRVSFDRGETWLDVIGVVEDVKQRGLSSETEAQVYTALSQTPNGLPGRVLVRTTGDPLAMAEVVRGVVRSIDPNQPVENIRTLDEVRSRHLATPRLTAMLLALFAGLALLVTLAGVGGVIATSVAQRTQEFGLRMALGASQSAVLGGVLRQGLTLVVLGLVRGAGGRIRVRPAAAELPVRNRAWRSADAAGRGRRVPAGWHARLPRAGAARDEGRPAGGAARGVESIADSGTATA